MRRFGTDRLDRCGLALYALVSGKTALCLSSGLYARPHRCRCDVSFSEVRALNSYCNCSLYVACCMFDYKRPVAFICLKRRLRLMIHSTYIDVSSEARALTCTSHVGMNILGQWQDAARHSRDSKKHGCYPICGPHALTTPRPRPWLSSCFLAHNLFMRQLFVGSHRWCRTRRRRR